MTDKKKKRGRDENAKNWTSQERKGYRLVKNKKLIKKADTSFNGSTKCF